MISDKSYERYNRQMLLKGFGIVAQQKLKNAKVLVIGAGGLGCPVLQYLAAAGVGTIGVADDDIVSLPDLHRQILYTTDDLGLPKVEKAAIRLRRLNDEINIITYQLKLENKNALEIIREYDWVADCTDNFDSRYMINDACVLLNKPLIYGAVSQYQGQVAVFNAAHDNFQKVNYRDLFPHPPKAGEVLNCAEAGVLGVLPGIIGTMQAAEIIKLITGIGSPLINKLLTYNVLNNQAYEVSLTPSAAGGDLIPNNETAFLEMNYSSFCNILERAIIEIDVDQFESLRKDPSAIVIDVREKGELPLVTNLAHRHIPMSVFKETISEIKEHTIILFCMHGIRSLYAGEMLQEVFGSSRNIYSLKGGVVKWGSKLGLA